MHQSSCPKPNLIYTVAFDPPGWRGGRTMAKLLCSSLLRQFWSGEIVVFRNSREPLFPVERKGLEEVFVDTPEVSAGAGAAERCLKSALAYRFGASGMLDATRFDWVVYLDADCLALRNLDHLFAGEADILVQPEKGLSLRESSVFNGYLDSTKPIERALEEDAGKPYDISPRQPRNAWLGKDGINAGTFAVRGCKYAEVMRDWIRIYESEPIQHSEFRDQTAFNKLLLETELRVKPFERGEIMFPFHLDKGFLDYREAALLHFVGGKQKDKIDLAFALHMMRVYGDEGGLFLDILES